MSNRPRHHRRRRPEAVLRGASSMPIEDFTDLVLSVLTDMINGDEAGRGAAVDRLFDMCPHPRDGFSALCAYANVIVSVAAIEQGAGPDAPTRVVVSRLDGEPLGAAPDELVASDVGAFVAAVGNDDYEGAWTVFDAACLSEETFESRHGAKFMARVLGLAAIVAAAHSDQGGRW